MQLWKPSYSKKLWKIILVFVVLSFLVGQIALYIIYGLQ